VTEGRSARLSLPLAELDAKARSVFLAALTLLVLTPVLYGVLTFERSYSFTTLRYFALPVLGAEILFLAAAFRAGHSPGKAFVELSLVAKVAWAVWFAGALVASIAVAPIPSYALLHLMMTVAHALVALTVWEVLQTAPEKRGNDLVLAMIAGIALFAVAAWAILFAFRKDPDFDWLRVGFGVSHVRHLSYLGVLAAGAGCGFAAYRQQGPARILAMSGIAIGSALCFWSGSRAGAGAALLSGLAAVLLGESGRRIHAAARVVGGFLIGAALSLIWVPPHGMWGLARILGVVQRGGATLGEVVTNRDVLWLEAIRLFRDHPWIGYGEGQFRFLSRAGWVANHPHDVILQLLVQWGLLGTLAMTVIVWRAVPASIRRFQKPLPGSMPALCGLVAVGAEALVDGPLFYAYPTLAAGILLVVLNRSDPVPRPAAAGADR
jgi:O-antigen ligase